MSSFKTQVELKLQGASFTYYSPESSEVVARWLGGGHPVYLQTYDGHCVIVNPGQVSAMEVYDTHEHAIHTD